MLYRTGQKHYLSNVVFGMTFLFQILKVYLSNSTEMLYQLFAKRSTVSLAVAVKE